MMPSKIKVKGWKLMGWKHNGKIEAPMWDHYRVKHACNNGKAMEKLRFRCVTTME